MPLVRENSQLYEVIKVGTVSGIPLAVSTISGSSVTVTTASGSSISVNDNTGSLTVDGKAYRVTTTITRPSNTTAYTAGDVVGSTTGSAILTLSGIGPSGGYVLVQSAALIFSDSTVPAGMGAFRVHVYNTSPTAIADNAPFDLVSGDRASYMGYIDLSAPQDLGSTIYTQVDYPGRLLKLTAASNTFFVEIETRGAYTPVSASTVELRVSTLEAGL
jgi:hypothetical protein